MWRFKSITGHRQVVGKEGRIRRHRSYTFGLPEKKSVLGLGTCQHIRIGFHMADKMLIRPFTPTRPLLPPGESTGRGNSGKQVQFHGSSNKKDLADGARTFELAVKTYFPTEEQPGGAISNILDNVEIGEGLRYEDLPAKSSTRQRFLRHRGQVTQVQTCVAGSRR
jgi:nitrate reductase (NAD(P)H)